MVPIIGLSSAASNNHSGWVVCNFSGSVSNGSFKQGEEKGNIQLKLLSVPQVPLEI
jgi:hypothetical protein